MECAAKARHADETFPTIIEDVQACVTEALPILQDKTGRSCGLMAAEPTKRFVFRHPQRRGHRISLWRVSRG